MSTENATIEIEPKAPESDEPPVEADASSDAPEETSAAPVSTPEMDRRRIEEQLAQLKRREAELRRALAIAEHPELADAIREVEGRAYGVARSEERLAQPLSTSEERRRERLEKKLAAAKEKRAEIDRTIAALEEELAPLGDARVEALNAERTASLERLFTSLARHAEAFEAAGLQAASLVPELERWLPELRAMADRRIVDA